MILQFMTMLQVVMLKRTYSGKYYTYVMRLLLKKKSVKFEESVPKSNPYWLRLFRCFLSKHLRSWFDQVKVSQFWIEAQIMRQPTLVSVWITNKENWFLRNYSFKYTMWVTSHEHKIKITFRPLYDIKMRYIQWFTREFIHRERTHRFK